MEKFRSYIETLKSEVESLRADKERLDWLESFGVVEAYDDRVKFSWDYALYKPGDCKSLRESIDEYL